MAVSGWLRKKGDVFGGSDICCLTGCPEGFQPYTVLACRVVAWMVRLMTGLPFWYSFPDFFWWSGGWHCTAASWELWRAKFWVWQYCWPICMNYEMHSVAIPLCGARVSLAMLFITIVQHNDLYRGSLCCDSFVAAWRARWNFWCFWRKFCCSLLEALHRNAVLSSTAIRAVSVEGLLLDCSLCNSS